MNYNGLIVVDDDYYDIQNSYQRKIAPLSTISFRIKTPPYAITITVISY